ncbi:MAG: hypothetical protein J6M55_04335 [Paludibacteraceae bacterium]|nr:hypothetical protein [Paludibacteraceae bacterium]
MKIRLSILFLSLVALPLSAHQLPDPHFEHWGDKFKDDVQLTDWHGSNVSQAGFKFTFMFRKPGRTGYCAYVEDQAVGVPKLGIGATGPGYMSLGYPWQYLKGFNVSGATAGTEGGIAWAYRPDTMAVWIKRTGDNTDKEDFHLLYYSWSGTAKGSEYKNKKGTCTATERVNEESDIRQSTDGNECGTAQPAKQIAEGWLRARAEYNEWTLVKVPVYYRSDARPTMCNVIFSAGNYPAFRANDGLYPGNGLYVDDVELIYSSRIDKLLVNGEEWKEFNPDTEKLQTLKLSNSEAQTIKLTALRGIGSLTNIKGYTAHFKGRKLDSSEMSIVPGELNGRPWVITVRAEDGSSTHVYKVKIVK